jgi:hypothetical protein
VGHTSLDYWHSRGVLVHVQNSLNAIKKKGLVKRFDLALSKEEEAEAIIETAEAIGRERFDRKFGQGSSPQDDST